MGQATVLERESVDSPAATIAAITARLHELPPEQLEDVLQFVQFLEFKYCLTPDDPSEDEALWDAVLAHQKYKQQHSEEVPEIYNSTQELLKAIADL